MEPGIIAAAVLWAQFTCAGIVIAVAGYHLCREGDRIARAARLSGSWVGLTLLAGVTSLPELVTGISAVTVAGAPNIAVGDALGSCVINLAFLVVIDFVHRAQPLYLAASRGHILSAAFGIVLIGSVGLNVVMSGDARLRDGARFFHLGFYSPAILVAYAIAMRTVFSYEQASARSGRAAEPDEGPPGLARAVKRFAIAALAVTIAGTWLPFVSARLADAMQWNRSFMGTLLVATVTSLPELAVSVSAIRIGALDMAVGNLLGSNMFNVAVVAIDDLVYTKGPLLSDVSTVHASTAFSAVIMTGIAIIGLFYRPRDRVGRTVGWVSLSLFTVYVLNAYVAFVHGE